MRFLLNEAILKVFWLPDVRGEKKENKPAKNIKID
jgi:hypothetical protein